MGLGHGDAPLVIVSTECSRRPLLMYEGKLLCMNEHFSSTTCTGRRLARRGKVTITGGIQRTACQAGGVKRSPLYGHLSGRGAVYDSEDEQATRRHAARSRHVPSSRLVLTPPTRERSSSTRPRSLLLARSRPVLRARQEFKNSLAGLPNRSCRLRLTGRWLDSGDH
ncbi:hypothetical protein OH77DRAFT_728531 [Trametes cingulata]|nr:hypothetical protein OH77DRAFT_728531 [Trametes cingulata]